MKQFELIQQMKDDELVKLLHEAARQKRSPEERRAQQISAVMSIVDNPDEETRKEVERIVDGDHL